MRIMTALHALEREPATTLKDLHGLWKAEWAALQSLPDNWQAELTKEKDTIKAKLQPKEQAA